LATSETEAKDLRYGRRVSGVSIMGGIKTNGVVVLLGSFVPSAQLGLFAVADRFSGLVREAVYQVNMQQVNEFSSASTPNAWKLLTRSVRRGTPMVFAASALLFLVSVPTIRVLYGPATLACMPLLAVGLAAMALQFPGSQCNTWIASRALLRKQYAWVMVASVAEIAAILILVPMRGAMGVMLSRTVVAVVGSALGLWLAMGARPTTA